MYGKGIMAIATRAFQTWALQLHRMLNGSDGQEHKVWLVPSKFNSMTFINDPRSVEGEVYGGASAAGDGKSANIILMERHHLKLQLTMGHVRCSFNKIKT